MKRVIVLLLAVSCQAADPRQEFEEWLTAEAEKHWLAREQTLATLDTRALLAARQRYVRETALELIGGLPATKSPLNARTTGGFTRQGYRVENVIFESQPGFRVTANLYLPTTGPGPYPAVLGVAGHSTNGKASATYQRAFIGFVRKGIAVLAYDPPGQGERLEYIDPATGRSRAGIGVGEHIMAGVPAMLAGETIARHFIYDGIRAFDYLLTRPEIDPKRIAVAGNSGGGTQAAYLAMFEPRLATAISSCYMTRWRELWSGPGPQDSEQIWPGFLSRGLDFGDFALAQAPRPYLITSAIRDYFPIDGARATFRELQRQFDQLGNGAAIGFFDYDDTHGWSQPRREAATRWLEKWFFGRDTDGKEDTFETEEESILYATPTGQLQSSFGSATMQSLTMTEIARLEKQRKPATLDTVKSAIGWQEPSGDVHVAQSYESPANPVAHVILVGGPANTPHPDARELIDHGYAVLTLHPRGTGPGYERAGASGYRLDYQLAARCWLLGRNLFELQTEDIVAAARALKTKMPGLPIYLYGRGRLAPASLLAALIEPKIERVAVEGMIPSWHDMAAAPVHEGLENTVVPGVLRHFDLPDLRRLLGPSRLVELSPMSAAHQPLRSGTQPFSFVLRGEGWPLLRSIGLNFFPPK